MNVQTCWQPKEFWVSLMDHNCCVPITDDSYHTKYVMTDDDATPLENWED
jgi:hypothetical protein